jgi:hypothetical protein
VNGQTVVMAVVMVVVGGDGEWAVVVMAVVMVVLSGNSEWVEAVMVVVGGND